MKDFAAFAHNLFSAVDQNGFFDVGGELIDTFNAGDEPHFMRLGDSSGHAGTVTNGIISNDVFIGPVNNAFGTSLVPFSDAEILQAAGISP